MSIARFKCLGHFDRKTEATILIDRAAGTFGVRPKGRRHIFALTLAKVAEMVVSRAAQGEAELLREERAKRRQGRKGK